MNYIDLRSDTVTWPTSAMRKAMAEAAVGDDVYGDDPTVNELERLAAEMTGKEAALFVPSGTFGNQLSLFTWCPRGSEVILGEQCHIIQHEAGAASVIAGVQTRPVFAPDGILPIEAIEERIRGNDIHFPPTSLVCLENAHSSGRVIPLSYMKNVSELAHRYGLPVHLDGARLFNAAAALGAGAAEIAGTVDSVMFCLSKGLCAPVGSMLAGPRDFVERARRKRKVMGGGMRQAGVLAAAGLIALKDMTRRLAEDHKNARYLAGQLGTVPGLEVDAEALDINMVFFRLPAGSDGDALVSHLKAHEVLINPPELGLCRFVTHYWIDREAIDKAAALMADFFKRG
ncbi:MAG: low-specificity L-threonine aldolase [Rectinema sp.]|jgi:threonine aldolase